MSHALGFLLFLLALGQSALAQSTPDPSDAQLFRPDPVAQAWIDGHRQRVVDHWREHPVTRELIDRAHALPVIPPALIPTGTGGYHYALHSRGDRNALVRVSLETLRANPAYDLARAEVLFAPGAAPEPQLVGLRANPYDTSRVLLIFEAGKRRFAQELDLGARALVADGILAEDVRSAEWAGPDRILYLSHTQGTEIGDSNRVYFAQRGVRGARAALYGHQTAEVTEFTDGRTRIVLVSDLIKRFWREVYALNPDGTLFKLNLPWDSVPLTVYDGHLVFKRTASAAVTDPGPGRPGSLLAIPLAELRSPRPMASARVLWEAGRWAQTDVALAQGDWLVLSLMEDGEHRLLAARNVLSGGAWKTVPLFEASYLTLVSGGDRASPSIYAQNANFVTSTRTSRLDFAGDSVTLSEIHREVDYVDPAQWVQTQHRVKSKDGAEVLYRLVYPREIKWTGKNPVLFTNYSGNYIPYSPRYNIQRSAQFWLSRGGVYAFAHARGGPERGIEWMEAGMGPGLQNLVNDIIAAAEDLIRRGITTSRNMGMAGGSHGMTTPSMIANQRPDLFRAMHVGYGLQDFLNYPNEGQSARWIDWYGLPWLSEHRTYLEKLSPIQNLPKSATVWPAMWLQGGSVDPNVHPVHSRIYAREVSKLSPEIWFHEGPNTGHGTNPDAEDALVVRAMAYAFLWQTLSESR